MYHNPQIDPINLKGTLDAACLVLHGFTGTPDSMRSVANALHQAGFHVQAPLLAGHGTTPENCAKTKWRDWYQSAQTAYAQLSSQFSKVFVCGLSMGALLTLKFAVDFPTSIHGIACLATPIHFKAWIRRVLPIVQYSPIGLVWNYQKKFDVDIKDPNAKANFWNYDLMPLSCIASIYDLQKKLAQELPSVKSPLLMIHSRHDSTAPYDSMSIVAQAVSSQITETITLENSYHVITLDYEKQLVAEKVTQFFKQFL